MRTRSVFALALTFAMAALVTGCSSSDSSGTKTNKGALSLTMGATGAAPAVQGAVAADQAAAPAAASVTISAAAARQGDGTWVNVQGSFPMTVDLIALAANGHMVTLPADVVPEGQYNALQFTITSVDLTLQDGTKVTLTPPGTGWVALIPVDFSVTAGMQTSITLRFHIEKSFKLLGGMLEFEPDVEVEGVEHH